jgi:ATP-dependent DNA ligase
MPSIKYKKYKMSNHTFPDLFSVEKNGKTRIWKASIEKKGDYAYATIYHGQLDGKLQETVREYTTGKNIGKKNQTTPYEQCFQETERKWKDKKEKENYTENIENIENIESVEKDNKIYLPMLANTYDPKKKSTKGITFPCYVQPKLDGLRCVVYKREGHILYQSRTAGYFETMSHLTPYLEPMFKKYPHLILDGELYTTQIPFEELAGLIKKKKLTDSDKDRLKVVEYHIYDIINEKETFEERSHTIDHLFQKEFVFIGSPLKQVVTTLVSDLSSFKQKFTEFVYEGYEGIMLRNIEGIYRCNYRSNDLQKYKEFLESEYEIVNFTEGDGRDKGSVIWVCKTEDGREFNVRPKGEMKQRQEWFKHGERYIGKKLTVIYQELSEKGVPRFPVGKVIRDYE